VTNNFKHTVADQAAGLIYRMPRPWRADGFLRRRRPLCRREIAFYRGLSSNAALSYIDVSDSSADVPAGTDRANLLARFHERRADGSMADGARGFVALWKAFPGLALAGACSGTA
jgi:hypothetical protein